MVKKSFIASSPWIEGVRAIREKRKFKNHLKKQKKKLFEKVKKYHLNFNKKLTNRSLLWPVTLSYLRS